MDASRPGPGLTAVSRTSFAGGGIDVALALAGMLALAAAMGIGRFVYTPILPAMTDALNLTKAQAGLIAAANFAGYLLGALIAATPRLPGGRRLWFIVMLALSAATTAAMGLGAAMAVFLPLRLAGGVASAFVLVLGSALVLDRLAASGRTGLAAIHFAGVGLGIAATAVLIQAMRQRGATWEALWIASGALAAFPLPFCLLMMAATRPAAAIARGVAASARLPRGLGRLTACHALFGFGYVVTATFLVAVIGGTPRADGVQAAVWLLVGLSAAPSTALWARASARFGALRSYGFAALLEAVGIAIGGLWPHPAGAVTAALLLGATFMGITALGFAAARALAPNQQHRSFALMTAGFGVGQIVGPIVAGYVMDHTGSFALPSLFAAAALAIAGIIALDAAPRLDGRESGYTIDPREGGSPCIPRRPGRSR